MNTIAMKQWIVSCAILLAATPAMAATKLDFEDLAVGTTVRAQYGPRGVLFRDAYLDSDPAAHSGTHILRSVNPSSEVFTPIPLVMDFTSAQRRVKFFGGSSFASLNGTLTGFDANNTVVATDGPRLVPQNTFTTVFEISVPTAKIIRAEFQLENSAHEAIDDLEFEGNAPPPPPTQPPVVQITSPANGADLDVNTIDIAGTVTGDGLLSPVALTMDFRQPPESTAGPFHSDLALTGTGTTRQFALPGFTGVPLGPITITVAAQNIGALTGTGTSTFTNLPGGIRSRFNSQGGAAVLGAFQYGLTLHQCKIAVYDKGAISDTKFLISGDILTKWLSIKGPFDQTGFFGCPLGDETDGPLGSRVQQFESGRIYKTAGGTFFVPAVFVDAISGRGGDGAIGTPLADPSSSPGVMQTWLFQQFTNPDSRLMPSTLEIRGTPPTLWFERQVGEFAGVFVSATRFEQFPCLDNLGPCTVTPEVEQGPPISNAGNLFCNGTTYIPGLEIIGRPPEWKAIQGDYVATPIFGVIVSAFYADIDNAFTHEFHFGDCKDFPNILEVFAPDCPSDYEFKIQPVGPQPGSFPFLSLFGKENPTNVKVEYELHYASAVHAFLDAPQQGDLVHATGRWIIDCGHDSFKSELHPIFSFGKMRTVLDSGHMATRADVWVTGWYPGGDGNAIEFDVFPPPRPTPDSVLHIVKPVDFVAGDNSFRAAEDVNLEFAFEPATVANHAHLRFTSPRRENTVTGAGEMMWEDHRSYWGMWFVFWSPLSG